MIGRLAAATLALALCTTAAEAAPQAVRAAIAAPADGASVAETAAAPTRRAPRRSARRVPASERVLAVPADAVVAAPAGAQPSSAPVQVMPPRRSVVRVAARPAINAPLAAVVVPAEQVDAPLPGVRSHRRAPRVAARAPMAAAPVETVAVPAGQVLEVPDAEPVGRGRRRAARVGSESATRAVTGRRSDLDARIAAHAQATGVPADLIHHVITRESRYNPGAIGPGGVYGLMQLKHGTARALGYAGSASGLLDPETNLTYGVRYLAGAYKVAGGNPTRAYSLFRSGYYYHAKRQGIRATAYAAAPEPAHTASMGAAPTLGDALSRIFATPAQTAQADPAR